MYIAATAVSMEAARSSREMEQHTMGMTLAIPMPGGTPDTFGMRLASELCSTTVMEASGQTLTGNHDTITSKAISLPAGQTKDQPPGPATESAAPALPVAAETTLRGTPPVQFVHLTGTTTLHQEETQDFRARGQVQTGDGRDITFDLGYSRHRETTAINTTSLGVAATLTDPLVLQFDLKAPLLSEHTFCFDLDSDGQGEQLACPGRGCGFLALDRNGDGRITNGLELFGPSSGSGFGELAEFDTDANTWIDEADPVFDQLPIWQPDGEGGGQLTPLRQAGVGAIAVLHAGTAFQLRSASGALLGQLKGSGIFLTEAGEVRSLQEIDLALPSAQGIAPIVESNQPGAAIKRALSALRAIITLQRLQLSSMLSGQPLAERLRAVENKRLGQGLLFPWEEGSASWSGATEQPADAASGRRESERPFAGTDALLARIVHSPARR